MPPGTLSGQQVRSGGNHGLPSGRRTGGRGVPGPHCCAQLRGYWTKEQNGETCLFSRHLLTDILLSLERGRTGVRQPIFPKLFADCALQVVQSSGATVPPSCAWPCVRPVRPPPSRTPAT